MRVRKDGDYARAVHSAEFFQLGRGGKYTAIFNMNRKQLEHIVRASGSISGCREVVIIGRQALLGECPDARPQIMTSMDAGLYPAEDPEKAALIDGCIGELLPFHEAFGYYAHGVGPETAVLPSGWKGRLIRVENENTGGTTGWCLSPVDLAVSKLLAGRPKDLEFIRQMARIGVVNEQAIRGVFGELAPDNASNADNRLQSALSGHPSPASETPVVRSQEM